MGQTMIIDETTEAFNSYTGEITSRRKSKVTKSKIGPTDEFVKVSRYLNTIFAYQDIPLNLVPISLLIAQRMEFKTNIVYLLKEDKEEMAEMLGITPNRVKMLIQDLKKYDIIRPTKSQGRFAVNGFLFSSGSIIETRNLQAKFDYDNDTYTMLADQKHLITGDVVRKIVTNKAKAPSLGLKGQLAIDIDGNITEE